MANKIIQNINYYGGEPLIGFRPSRKSKGEMYEF